MLRLPTLLVCIALLLAGCGGTGIRPGIDDQRHWQLRGKIGLRGPQLAESAYLNWRQCGEDYEVRLSGPLGQTVARIEGRGAYLTVTIQGREPVTTDQPEELLQQQLGWSVPLRALRYWVRAEAAPGGGAEIEGPAPQPTTLRQLGWQVDYLAYHQSAGSQAAAVTPAAAEQVNRSDSSAAAMALPAKLVLRDDGRLQITLLVSEWLLSDAVEGCAAVPPGSGG